MSLTNQAPWPKRRLARNEMRAQLADYLHGKNCWQFGKYLGSMLFFDFGGHVSIPSMRQGKIDQGEATLGVRDCYWRLSNGNVEITDSELISDENAVALLSGFRGAYLDDLVVKDAGFLNLVFSNQLVLSLDTNNRYATKDSIAEFTLPDGRIYCVTPGGHIYLSDQVSTVRFKGLVR